MSGAVALQVKVCGLREPENITQVDQLKPERIGLIFYPKSRRFVGEHLTPEGFRKLDVRAQAMGVFVNEGLDTIAETVAAYGLAGVQLHGDESPDFCASLRARLPHATLSKAFGVDDAFELGTLSPYAATCDYFVLDTKTAAYGGSGRAFDWDVLKGYETRCDVPFLLAGGLGPANVAAACALQAKLPLMQGVDLNSQVEEAPGRKSIPALTAAIAQVRAHQRQPTNLSETTPVEGPTRGE